MFSRRKQGTKDEPGSFGQQGEKTQQEVKKMVMKTLAQTKPSYLLF
jgi:hypothetical protein